MSRQSININVAKQKNKVGDKSAAVLAPLKLAVVGAGAMGQHHLRICHQLKEVKLCAVVDVDKTRAEEMAALYGIEAYTDVDELQGKVDAVIIAVPSVLHREIGRRCLLQNIHCLIEKPLAVTEAECVELIQLAEKNKLILLVGHVERFNAAVQQLMKELTDKHRILAVQAQRLNFNIQRTTDIDVILDLMTHDLDIILSLIKVPVNDYVIKTICRLKKGEADFSNALIEFSNGAVANVMASRITPKKIRQLEVTTESGFYSLDFIKQEIWLHRDNNQMEQIAVHKQDALTVEILNFVHSVQTGIALGVTGHEALRTLKLIWQLQAKDRKQQKLLLATEG